MVQPNQGRGRLRLQPENAPSRRVRQRTDPQQPAAANESEQNRPEGRLENRRLLPLDLNLPPPASEEAPVQMSTNQNASESTSAAPPFRNVMAQIYPHTDPIPSRIHGDPVHFGGLIAEPALTMPSHNPPLMFLKASVHLENHALINDFVNDCHEKIIKAAKNDDINPNRYRITLSTEVKIRYNNTAEDFIDFQGEINPIERMHWEHFYNRNHESVDHAQVLSMRLHDTLNNLICPLTDKVYDDTNIARPVLIHAGDNTYHFFDFDAFKEQMLGRNFDSAKHPFTQQIIKYEEISEEPRWLLKIVNTRAARFIGSPSDSSSRAGG